MILEKETYQFGTRAILLVKNDNIYEVSKAILCDKDTYTYYRIMANIFSSYEEAKTFYDSLVKEGFQMKMKDLNQNTQTFLNILQKKNL